MSEMRFLVIGLLLNLVTAVACVVALGIALDAFVEYFTTDDISTRTFWNFVGALLSSMVLAEAARRWSDK